METPIKPGECNLKKPIKGPIYDEAIRFVNEAICGKRWHKMVCEKQDIQDNYYAILQNPYDMYTSVMPLVVESFKNEGWDCFFSYAYDGRGPHHCFYVNKKHFD